MPFSMKSAGQGPYKLNIPVQQILDSKDRVNHEGGFDQELEADLKVLNPLELLKYLPLKKNGGLMQNRKVILKKYKDTAYDPGYHETKLRVWALRIVPIDEYNAIVSLDDVTITADDLNEPDIL